ncbi:MAG: DUF4263 domain-containing protein [Proteobacteria bacterium]|nr:DUF4263 domain-containing protein [Candidatus Enterousia onthequi]
MAYGTNIDVFHESKNDKVFYYIKDDEDKRTDIYVVDKVKKIIEYYIASLDTNAVILEGFACLPDFVKPKGGNFKTTRLTYYLNKFIKQKSFSTLVISLKQGSSISSDKLTLNIIDFKKLRQTVIDMTRQSQIELNGKLFQILNEIFPQVFSEDEIALPKTNKSFLLNAIDTINTDNLTEQDVAKITNFAVSLSNRFKRQDVNERVLIGMKDKIRIKTLEDILGEYKKLLAEEPNEQKWQLFFEKYIRVFDTGYVENLSKVNISVFSTKKPDLMMLDLHNYIDIYELKITKTNLLNYDASHDNYYWHSDIVKVIAQAEKYIKQIQDGASDIIRTIKTQTNKDVEIIRPKAIIIAGHSKQLKNEKQKQDFKMLRESLKNISFVLYDEFYNRLKNFYELLQKKNS